MTCRYIIQKILLAALVSLVLTGCFRPPFNNFKSHNYVLKPTATGATVGTVVGAFAGSTLMGTGIGGAAGLAVGLYKDSKGAILRELEKSDIMYIQYGDTTTLIVPTDRYFLFNTPRLNDICFPGLTNIIRLLKFYPDTVIYVAGFTDNIGSSYHKKRLTQARAEAMLTYLWANGISSARLRAEGYGDKNAVAPNSIIHGSAFNRRLEIQWFKAPPAVMVSAPAGFTK